MDYDDLEHALRDSSAAPHAPRDAAAEALAEIASGRRELRAVRHPLGFLCLPLLRDGERGVCVHLFADGGSDAAAGGPGTAAGAVMHAHSWELRSHVLYGTVANVPVRVRDSPSAPTHRVFEVRSDPTGVDELLPTQRLVRCEPGEGHTSSRGQTYTLPAGEFHATLVTRDAPAATLVLGRSLPGRSDLVLGPLCGDGHSTVRRLCGAEHTQRSVRTALRRVHAQQRR